MPVNSFMSTSDMKKFILKISLFFLIIGVIDFLLGKLFYYAYLHAANGYTERYNYIYSKTKEDVLIFGSSRALDHFTPDTIEKYLHQSCYNCGEDASGIMLIYPRLNIIQERYTPKTIIYDIYNEDFIKSANKGALKTLKLYYDDENVYRIYNALDPTLKIKLLSNLYKYNSSFIDYIVDNIRKSGLFYKGQYVMAHTVSDKDIKVPSIGPIEVDTMKLFYFEKFIRENKDKIAIYFTISPSYKGTENSHFKTILNICHKYNMPVFNHYNDTAFTNHYEYFANPQHLNLFGSNKFTRVIAKEILTYNDSIAKLSKHSINLK